MIQNLQDRFSAIEDATTLTSLTRLFSPVIKVDEKDEDIQTVSAYLKVKETCTEEMKCFLRFVEKKTENGHQTLQTTKDVAQ